MKFKKKQGSIHKFAIPLVTIVSLFVLIIIYISASSDLYKKDKIDILAREYLLRIEATGYLNNVDQSQLVKDLQGLGAKNIDLSGTTFSKVGYGKKASISINCDLEINDYKIKGWLGVEKIKKTVHIPIFKSTTAKY